MNASTLMVPIRDAIETLQHLIRTDWPAQQAIDNISRVAALSQQFRDAKSLLSSGEIRFQLDPDFSVHDALDDVKMAARLLRREMGEIAQFASITAEVYKAANQLQWEISEHDVDYSPRKSGYVAQNAQESDEVLDRILREQP